MKNFNKVLKENFKGKNLSELSRQLGVPRSVLADWCDDKQPSFTNMDYIMSIANFLGLSLEELLVGNKSPRILSSITFEDDGRKYQVLITQIK
ncbi:MAG: helix-turn-helix domain-containing protein [Bacteriovorax sp.]|jgi:hypothetical protein